MICWSGSRHETCDTELTQLRSTGDHDTRVQGGPDVLCSTIVSVTDTILSKHYVIVRVTLPSLSSTDIVQMFQIKNIVTRQFSSFWNNNKYNKEEWGSWLVTKNRNSNDVNFLVLSINNAAGGWLHCWIRERLNVKVDNLYKVFEIVTNSVDHPILVKTSFYFHKFCFNNWNRVLLSHTHTHDLNQQWRSSVPGSKFWRKLFYYKLLRWMITTIFPNADILLF